MILEIEDLEKTHAYGSVAVPPGLSLGEIFDHDPKLRQLAQHIVQAKMNGLPLHDWRSCQPVKGDRVKIVVTPGAFFSILSAILTVVSVVQFFISLFNQPKARKTAVTSPTYTFEGLADTIVPGEPVPVVYGRHAKGGQVLMYYVDVSADKKGQEMSMLLGMAEGEATSMSGVQINGTYATTIQSVSVAMRMGLSSQSIITGFENIKNTFFDGRELPSTQATSNAPIVYTVTARTAGNVTLQVLAPNGLFYMRTVGRRAGEIRAQTVYYNVQLRNAETYENPNQGWVDLGDKPFAGRTREAIFDTFIVNPVIDHKTEIKVAWARGSRGAPRPGIDGGQLVLQNVTEESGVADSASGTALLGIRAAATQELHGGRPNVTAIVHGQKVRVYTSTVSFTTQWTQVPAWCMLDYMTNSVYGMGAWITYDDVNIQSFIDFATLGNSQATICGDKVL